MIVNERGHIEMADGKTTEVQLREMAQFYVGNEFNFITFRHMLLDDGRVVVHSELHDASGPLEDFLYEVVDRTEAIRCATSMIDDAIEYLESLDISPDNNDSPDEFIALMRQALYHRLH